MNCNQGRYELSQCLDGRLPSGRRALVMEHVEKCAECGAFWTELQAAQRLVLELPREHVGERFREQLWERIRAGEGTPEAVFHEPIPFAAKVRYALTGAAAAAAVLLVALALRHRDEPKSRGPEVVAEAKTQGGLQPRTHFSDVGPTEATLASDDILRLDRNPLLSSTRRLTTDLVALEAARQLEQRYATVHQALDRLQDRSIAPEIAVDQMVDNADELHSFGELLLEMSDRRRLVFVEPEVGTDLRVAVGLLGQTKVLRRDRNSLTEMVGRALQSRRLSNISGMISVVPFMDPREEREVLARLNILRPEVFPKLFIVFGTDDDLQGVGIRNGTFVMDDSCGASWVAPRSVVEARDNLLRWTQRK
jgi:anti-sigma factor RsiW